LFITYDLVDKVKSVSIVIDVARPSPWLVGDQIMDWDLD
jgi:hypothetical protein